MVVTSIENDLDFDFVAQALLEQHANAHLDDSRDRSQPHDKKEFAGRKGFHRHAKLAEEGVDEQQDDD
eukprot:11098514-Karenia_brevis.AAC.1